MVNLSIKDLPMLKKWRRESLINWLQTNDKNGCYTDELAKAEGLPRLTKKEALEIIKNQLLEA